VNIPVLFIGSKAGAALSAHCDNDPSTSIHIRVDFPVDVENEVNYLVGLSFGNLNTFKFLKDFKRYHDKLGNTTHMSIAY
jgi:hypothetical protein